MTETTNSLLGRCKENGCEYTIFGTTEDVQSADTFRDVRANTGIYRVGNNGFFARCSNGHKVFPVKRIKGTYSPDHKCDTRCLNARGWECTCSCGGANHGRGHAVAVVTASDVSKTVTRIERPQTESKHLGEVGKHITGEVVVQERRIVVTGDSELYIFHTVNGAHVIKWFAPDYANPQWEVGLTLKIRAKVKRHEDHERFGKSTIVTYVERIED